MLCVVPGSPDADCEVLRRDLAADVGRECFSELRRTGQNGSGSHTTLPHGSISLGNTVWHVLCLPFKSFVSHVVLF